MDSCKFLATPRRRPSALLWLPALLALTFWITGALICQLIMLPLSLPRRWRLWSRRRTRSRLCLPQGYTRALDTSQEDCTDDRAFTLQHLHACYLLPDARKGNFENDPR